MKYSNITLKQVTENNNYPISTHQGKLLIADIELNVAVLDNGLRVISRSTIFKSLDRTSRGWYKDRKQKVINKLKEKFPEYELLHPPIFLDSIGLLDCIDEKMMQLLQPIKYNHNNKLNEGYDASLLNAICNLYLKARREGKLNHQQEHLAEKAEILQSSFAEVGIAALVDEATGYQYDRKHDALRILLKQYIEEGMQKWIKTFPDDFFSQLDRLYDNKKTEPKKRPMYYGKFINTYIYEPIENGYVKKELDKLNIDENKKRKARFHQWLSEHGRDVLNKQIWRILGIMETSSKIETFKKKINHQKLISIAPFLFDELNQIDDLE